MKKKEKIYDGNVYVTKENEKEWELRLKEVTRITGFIRAYQGATITISSMALAQTGDIIAYQGATITISSMALAQCGFIRAYQGATITIPSMALAQTGDMIADQGATITIPSMALAQTGYIRAYQGATITIPSMALAQCGFIYIESNEKLEKRLWEVAKKSKWHINEKSSKFIIGKNPKNADYKLNNVNFSREWFMKIKNDELTPDEIFAIDNIEHRRIAYEFMDKSKMKQLKDYVVLDEVSDDGNGYPMKIVSFTVQNMKEPLLFYNCHCSTSGREYFIGTDKKTCYEAKNASFGLENVEFIKEW